LVRRNVFMDPFGIRDEACWKCIVSELRKSSHTEVADRLQAALDHSFAEQELRTYDRMYPGDSMFIDPAAQTCKFAGTCRW
jgi:hypothetical protein